MMLFDDVNLIASIGDISDGEGDNEHGDREEHDVGAYNEPEDHSFERGSYRNRVYQFYE